MERVTITVDARERRSGVPCLLTEVGVEIEIVTLAVGDDACGNRVVERKAVADLHRSLVASRLWGQVGALRRGPAVPTCSSREPISTTAPLPRVRCVGPS
jgi:ERCC4-type nuclease